MSGRPGPPPRPSGSQVRVDSLVQLPGRLSRPPRLAVILRGLPGAGKSHVAKLLKEKGLDKNQFAYDTFFMKANARKNTKRSPNRDLL